ncbi:MAG: N-acyl homoserine lactonase family protein [Alicyclobacillus herbarius]|uniref:N-acyl homoserine lactonase family protein n=1 Tax=Alicyclobacillus herbarius TaxID=122960 RepID=UPI002355ADE8|nr:N-acyl homoserine lactonase family protein [Alicyclobacillus herbarius]MCL6634078.1 N-acyl homoserine lactonase family protein [Alicyclobacillus herbarius]
MAVKRLLLLPAGHCLVDESALDTRKKPGVLVDLPIWAYLIETTDGPVLVDTGMPERCVDDAEGYFRGTEDEGLIVPKMRVEDAIVPLLQRAGYQPQDLCFLISSHWHFDHAGGNRHFRSTPIFVQRAEYEAAMAGGYPEECCVPGLNYQLLDGDTDVAPGIHLLSTPGHSPGHQSLLIETPNSGPVLLTVDASYTRANYEEGVPFAGVDATQMQQSIARLHEVAKASGARVFFGHDPQQAGEWPAFPHGL